jgi:hypothetical protein
MNLLLVAGFTAKQVVARRKTVLLVCLASAPAVIGLIVRRWSTPHENDPFLDTAPSFYLIFLCQILPLFFAGSLVRDAVEDRTAAFLLTTPTSRTAYVLGSFLGLLPPLCVIIALSVGTAFAAWRGGIDDWWRPDHELPLALNLAGVACVGAIVYAALFTWLGLVAKWPTVIGILYYGIVELFLGWMAGPPRRLAVSSYLDVFLAAPFRTRGEIVGEQPGAGDLPIDPASARVTLLVIFAAALLLMTVSARRRDFVDEASGK